MSINYSALDDEVTNDPLGRGYAGMTDAQVADDLHLEDQSQAKEFAEAGQVYESIDRTEYDNLGAAAKDRYKETIIPLYSLQRFLSMGMARDWLQEIFGNGSLTLATYDSTLSIAISRARELQLGNVREADVTLVRNN